jgi:hypothetical protein
MEYRQFGRTGLEVSALGFGCGAVGGLLIKGDRKEMVRVVARAVELGITYFPPLTPTVLAMATRASVQCTTHGARVRSRQPPPARQPEDSSHVGDVESTDPPLIPAGSAG